MQIKKTWKQVHGVLLLDKAPGMTSNDALQKARRLFSAAKAGHTGTLDPLATGLLPVCFGEATKFSADLLDADKIYEATLQLGVTTLTGDAEGEVRQTRPVRCGEAEIRAALPRFTGDILQVPPMFSALKRDGKPLYELARQGIVVEREARPVRIHALDLLDCEAAVVRLRVHCSKGTYVRTLAEDLGELLGCGAHLLALRRIGAGDLSIAGALTLEAIASLPEDLREARLAPVDALLQSLPRIDLEGQDAERFRHGNPVRIAGLAGKGRAYVGNLLIGTGETAPDGKFWPKRLVQCVP